MTCIKPKYLSHQEATKDMLLMRKINYKIVAYSPYECPDCGFWHIHKTAHMQEAVKFLVKENDMLNQELRKLKMEFNQRKNSTCKCTVEETTGWTKVRCCNICGKPLKGQNWEL